MRIEPGNNAQRIWQVYQNQKASVAKGSGVVETSKDDMTLSDEARLFKDIAAAAKAAPDIRQDKVEGITNAINSGLYNIDAGKIAEGIINEISFDQKA
ncbi:MAG: negative regulator of flagellin synthesis FlgM [Clostridiales bacterium]|nr:negative regulator of flagellin synthesis FlgM [Clostridiales bacterium]